MKTLLYERKTIYFKSPKDINFKKDITRILYTYAYNKLPDNGKYEFYFDTDQIFLGDWDMDLLEVFKSEGLKFTKQEASKGKKLNKNDQNKLRVQMIIRKYLFNYHPEFAGLFNNNILNRKNCIDNAKLLLGIHEININNFVEIKLQTNKSHQYSWTRDMNESENQSEVSTLGDVSEKLVEGALKNLIGQSFFKTKGMPDVNSYGDFVLLCLPNNLWLSVKSGFSRERLLASGFSSDIIGIGFFQDYSEFISAPKNRNLKKVGFLAIYCPDFPVTEEQKLQKTNTFKQVKDFYSKSGMNMPLNVNGNQFIRKLSSLHFDLEKLLKESDIKKRSTIDF